MAIDTRAKRQNVAQVGYPAAVSVLPSGGSSARIRYQIGWSYLPAAAPPPAGGDEQDRLQLGMPWSYAGPGAHPGISNG